MVEAPRYQREVDEPAFEKAGAVIKEKRTFGQVTPLSLAPAGGIRLRHPRAKESEQQTQNQFLYAGANYCWLRRFFARLTIGLKMAIMNVVESHLNDRAWA